MATRREALERRAQELRNDIAQAWANGDSIQRVKLLRSYLDSAMSELRALDREARPTKGPFDDDR